MINKIKSLLLVLLLALALGLASPVSATISTEQSTVTLQGNGVTSVFTFPFVADSTDNIVVSYTDSDGTTTPLTTSVYNVSINAATAGDLWGIGGTVTYPLSGSPIAAGTSLTIQRVLPLQQTTDISNQGNFYPQVVESTFDTELMQIQQLAARTGQFRGVWQTGNVYNYADIVQDGANGLNSDNYYMAIQANTSDDWSDDLAAGDWQLIIPSILPSATFPLSIANGGTGQITAPAALTALGGVGLSTSNTFTSSNSFVGGSIAVPSAPVADNSTKAASTHFVNGTALTLATGTSAVTQSSSDNTTKVATDAFVQTLVNGAAASVKSVHVQQFTGSGTYTPTTGMIYAIIDEAGAGGGTGGSAAGGNSSPSAGAGGYLRALLTAAQIGVSQVITIGAAGTAGAGASNTTGGNGGTTTVGGLLTAAGGIGTSGTGSATASGGAGGGVAVSTGVAMITIPGQQGGGMGNVSGNSVGLGQVGFGGSNPVGFGGPAQFGQLGTTTNGIAGTGYGAGASGSWSGGAGAAGTSGIVTITEFCTQ